MSPALSGVPPHAPGLRLGVDLLRAGELDRVMGRGWFTAYVYAPGELAEASWLGPARRREYLSGRFAAKEALLKVLGRGLFQGVAPRDITVLRRPEGAPAVTLGGSAARAAADLGLDAFAVSLSHKDGIVAAVAAGWRARPAGDPRQAAGVAPLLAAAIGAALAEGPPGSAVPFGAHEPSRPPSPSSPSAAMPATPAVTATSQESS
nr:4'-phosphopantetheinyl transferase superfamily protein [Streptomyces sp. NBC_00899]WSX81423.1 4'-phosphopantetheinyl transferase superfamily protein [Streptomyces sp. NBC_00899]